MQTRHRLRTTIGLALLCAAITAFGARRQTASEAPAMQSASEQAQRHLIPRLGSERASSGAGNKIVTYQDRTHVVWQDCTQDGYSNRVRSYDHRSGGWSDVFTLNQGKDNHARPVITMDHRGYLHAIMSGHNSPVTHRRSVRPSDASAWTEAQPAGSGTYPIVVCGPDDTLYLTLRSSRRWNGVDLYVKPLDGPWRQKAKLVKRAEEYSGYGAFHNGLAWAPDGTLHMVCDFYESKAQRGVHQAVCYMRSRDGGETWQKADDAPVELPARPEHMDVLARDTGPRHEAMPPPVILAQGCIAVDSRGTPYGLYVSHLEKPGQVMLATTNREGKWMQRAIDAAEQAYPRMRPIGCRGALSIDEDDTLYLLLELVPLGAGWVDGKPTRGMRFLEEPVKRLVWLVSEDGGRTFRVRPALEPGLMLNQANTERPTGVNTIPAGRMPPFAYFDGLSRYREPGELIQNNVYLVMP